MNAKNKQTEILHRALTVLVETQTNYLPFSFTASREHLLFNDFNQTITEYYEIHETHKVLMVDTTFAMQGEQQTTYHVIAVLKQNVLDIELAGKSLLRCTFDISTNRLTVYSGKTVHNTNDNLVKKFQRVACLFKQISKTRRTGRST